MVREESFPRDLTPLEKDLLLWLLPDGRSGYRNYRGLVLSWRVAGKGRRGEGNYVLAPPGTVIDNDSPLPQIFAYGVVESSSGNIAVTIRERFDDQLEFEIVNLQGESVPLELSEVRRWSYSLWQPGQPCPACAGILREVEMKTERSRRIVLALCSSDKRIWVYDEISGVNHPVPATNYYNELMLHTNVRDPKVALDSRRLFSHLQTFSDADLSKAFASYNTLKTKIVLEDPLLLIESKKRSLFQRLRSLILKS
jgi:hypothetical protein